MSVLDGGDAACGEGAAVAQTVDLVDDRHRRIARPHEIAMQRVDVALAVNRALGRHQRLADHLAAEDALPADLVAATTIQVVFKLLEVEYVEKLLHGLRHLVCPRH